MIKGILTKEENNYFLLGSNGQHYLKSEPIWDGYIKHWLDKQLCARHLSQCDYTSEKPIIIMWPDITPPSNPYVEIYYNERLVKYPMSFMGHIAINVNGEIFNYSHLLNENEIINIEEYFYRPALGEFAPHPDTGSFNIDDNNRPYYDKFGRLFMRTIHVLRIEGLDTNNLSRIYHKELDIIKNTPVNPKKPHKYKDINIFTRNCATIIRDGLKKCGYPKISGIFPRDVFISASHNLFKAQNRNNLKVELFRLNQLKVPEASYSTHSIILNPINITRNYNLTNRYTERPKKHWILGNT